MGQPFEFKNPLDGAPPRLDSEAGKNPFSDGDSPDGEVSRNVYATSSDDVADQQPTYVTTYAHRGALLVRIAVLNLLFCVAASIGMLVWTSFLASVVVVTAVLGIAIAVKAGYDAAAMRSSAMESGGEGRTITAMVLSIATTLLAAGVIAVLRFG